MMRKMASPRLQELTALKRVARYTIKYPRITCTYRWTELDSNIEVCGDANFAGCNSTRKSTVGGDAMWSGQFGEGVVGKYGSLGLEQWRVRIGSGGESTDRRYGTAINFERPLFVWPRGD